MCSSSNMEESMLQLLINEVWDKVGFVKEVLNFGQACQLCAVEVTRSRIVN